MSSLINIKELEIGNEYFDKNMNFLGRLIKKDYDKPNYYYGETDEDDGKFTLTFDINGEEKEMEFPYNTYFNATQEANLKGGIKKRNKTKRTKRNKKYNKTKKVKKYNKSKRSKKY